MSYQSELIKRYKAKGYLVVKLINTNVNGIPDLMILKDGKAAFIECKTGGDTLKTLQKFRIDELRGLGFEACCMKDDKVIY